MNTLLDNKQYLLDMQTLAKRIGDIADKIPSFSRYFDGCDDGIRSNALDTISEFSGKVAFARTQIVSLEKRMRGLEGRSSVKLDNVASAYKMGVEKSKDQKDGSTDRVYINMPLLYSRFSYDLDLFVDYLEYELALFDKLLTVVKADPMTRYRMVSGEMASIEGHIFGKEFPSMALVLEHFDEFARHFKLNANESFRTSCISGYSPYGKVQIFYNEAGEGMERRDDPLEIMKKYEEDPAVMQFTKFINAARPVAVSLSYNRQWDVNGMLRYAEINYGSKHNIYGRVHAIGKDMHEIEDDIRRYMFSHFYYRLAELINKGAQVGIKTYGDKEVVEVYMHRVPVPDAARTKMLIAELLDAYMAGDATPSD
ncbi:MAG: hypothetical protein QXW10_03025 [Candidatus Micrarchaeaceae archaeon]